MRRIASLLILAGCGGGSANGSASANVSVSVVVHDDLTNPAVISSCSGGADAAANLAIISDLRDSYHEMVVCGGLAYSWSIAVIGVIADAIEHKKGQPLMIYKGNGIYASRNGMMEIQTVLTSTGQGIGFDVMDPNSYLAGLSIQASAGASLSAAASGHWGQALGQAAASAQVSFQAQGPGFALLGMTEGAARSGKFDLASIKHAIGDGISVINRIDVHDTHGDTTVHYILQGKPQKLGEWIDGQKVPMTLASVEATNSKTGQSINVTNWNMDYIGKGHGQILDGTIALDVLGGAFNYSAKFTYPHRAEPDIELACAAPTAPAAGPTAPPPPQP
jgi:hypothetical protein